MVGSVVTTPITLVCGVLTLLKTSEKKKSSVSNITSITGGCFHYNCGPKKNSIGMTFMYNLRIDGKIGSRLHNTDTFYRTHSFHNVQKTLYLILLIKIYFSRQLLAIQTMNSCPWRIIYIYTYTHSALVSCPFVSHLSALMLLANLHQFNFHSLIFNLTPLGWLHYILLTTYFSWEYNFPFTPFWFMPTISEMQLGCKTMAGHVWKLSHNFCQKEHHMNRVHTFYLCYNVKNYIKIWYFVQTEI